MVSLSHRPMSNPSSPTTITYPQRHGQPIADTALQLRWIVMIQANLEWLFVNDPHVLVAGDLLWYPVEGNPKICCAPHTFIAFGRPKGDRGSYQQWLEDQIAPQVVFEIASPHSSRVAMNHKLLFYDRYEVEEYYLYDPSHRVLTGWQRSEGFLDLIESMENWVSPRLGIRFDLADNDLRLLRPDGQPFLTYPEMADRVQQVNQRLMQVEQQLKQTQQQLEETWRKSQVMADRLRDLGLDPDCL